MRKNRFRYNLATLRATEVQGNKRGMTRAALAQELDCAPKTIQCWEIEKNEPKLSHLIRIADFFGVTLDQLVFGENLRR